MRMTGPFTTRCEQAVADKRLRKTLKNAARIFRQSRADGMDTLPDPEAARDRAEEVKRRCLENLPAILEMLEENVIAAGGHVHWARTGAEANAIVADIARAEGVKAVVKGKSMVTEETGLNHLLESQGIEVNETDLGEWIVQLADEKPSHIVGPALHKNRHEVSELFHEHLGEPITDDIPTLTLMARRALREKFLEADMGITGANMLVAETGTVVLIENEGNIRMSTTLPRVHVAVASLEKAVQSMEDMAAILAVLPRSCTGQVLSSYTSLITGPRREDETDGAEVFHLVLLDNGRSKVLADPEMRPILNCIRCGACFNFCPAYIRVGGLAFPGTYSGPMGSILAPLLAEAQGVDNPYAQFPYFCTTCGACRDACPVRIDHPRLLMKLRARHADTQSPLPPLAAAAFARLTASPRAWKAATTVARTLDPNLKLARRMPGIGKALSLWARKRRLPSFKEPFSKTWKPGKTTRQGGRS
ncbi:LutB/LldF family L-lactate oxidation iron-sulfur protein [Desulfovibrio ferrophilus]|uniref:Iron-sulfur cluster binding protein n=1 Tax=Desulfovibrio ferrophilus TaxID=241368 RepID=A0A2Z6B1K6_9BACT|nr:LutB/LldF family L-lactate oxidation iron-sulfur protein [Desulfovibrio ferrophilus]BBD09361.1 iron-sulfur cluster binding protein [Desulfovibrio ferrophilus]